MALSFLVLAFLPVLVVIEDLHATIFRALGISPRLSYEIEQRPFYVTRDGKGTPIPSLFG